MTGEDDAIRFDYERDDVRRRIRITARQPLRAADLTAIVDRQLHDNAWTYGILYDLRTIATVTSRVDADAVADYVRASVGVHGPRGSVALITRRGDIVAMGQIYAMRSAGSGFDVEVFWDLADGEGWLDGQVSPAP
jgi:hypothetical protein